MKTSNPLSTSWSIPHQNLSSHLRGDVFDDFERLVNAFIRPNYANTVGFKPTCDIYETKDHYLVSFDMPGVKKEDIKIEVQGNQLVVSGERQREIKEEEGALRYERVYGKFDRSFVLPTSINIDKIEAHYENGVLNLALPKSESTKGRKIQIQSGQDGSSAKALSSKKEVI